jgi:DNA invertase Pin-like site-specific DNA recombinase
MSLPLQSQTALVTGSSKGVGKGIALELARSGCDVAVNYNSDAATVADAALRKFGIVLCWKLDRFGRSLRNCLSAIQGLQADTDESNPASRFLLHILMAAAEFERELIRERSLAGLKRYHREYQAGKVGKETRSRSGKNLPIGRPRRVFDRQRVIEPRQEGLSYREIAARLGVGEGTVRRVFRSLTDAMGARQKPVAEGLVRDAHPMLPCSARNTSRRAHGNVE